MLLIQSVEFCAMSKILYSVEICVVKYCQIEKNIVIIFTDGIDANILTTSKIVLRQSV